MVPGRGAGVEQGDRGAGGVVDGGGGGAVPLCAGTGGVEGWEGAGCDAEEGVDQLGFLRGLERVWDLCIVLQCGRRR